MAERLEKDLETLARGLASALGPDLVSLLLYGSAARGSRIEGRSDVNLLLVVRDASPAVLRRASPALAQWSRAGRYPPLIHSEAEWQAAADVFPVEMDDIRDAHRVLAGSDPTGWIATKPADVRREMERETRGVLTRLRAAWAALGGSGRELESVLTASAGTVLVLLRAAIRLSGRRAPDGPGVVVSEAAALCGFDAAAFDWVLAARQGQPPRRLEPFDDEATKYLEAVEKLASWVNNHQEA